MLYCVIVYIHTTCTMSIDAAVHSSVDLMLSAAAASHSYLAITTWITTHLKWMGWTLDYKINNLGHNDLTLISHVTSVLRSNRTKNEAWIFSSFILCQSNVNRQTDGQTDRQTDGRTPELTHFISSAWAFSPGGALNTNLGTGVQPGVLTLDPWL